MTIDPALVIGYLRRQRWFADPDDDAEILAVRRLPWLDTGGSEPRVRVELVTLRRSGRELTYALPLAYYIAERPSIEHAYVGSHVDEEGTWAAYDALHDRAAVRVLVTGFAGAKLGGGLDHHTTGPVELPADAATLVLTGEQSNTSVVIGEDLVLKVFRVVEPGGNPDVEVHAALAEVGSSSVAPLRGWISTADGYDLAMLSDFLRTATDGWEYARASVRELLAEGDLYADEVGGDFAGEAERLGTAVARLHADLASVLPSARWGREQLRRLANRLHHRLDVATGELPALAEHRAPLAAAYEAVIGLAGADAHRVHGDLHLGQTLRDVDGWRVIDFEGEPAKPLAERVGVDSPLRDVAGMLRSFDYAAHSVARPDDPDRQRAHRTGEWAERNRNAFRTGYGAGLEVPGAEVLLRAYEIDKAVYEAVYEKRHRPAWLPIPMTAIRRLAAETGP